MVTKGYFEFDDLPLYLQEDFNSLKRDYHFIRILLGVSISDEHGLQL